MDFDRVSSQGRLDALWNRIVNWFCPTLAGQARVYLDRMIHGDSERARTQAFFALQGLAGEGCQHQFSSGKHPISGELWLSLQVDGQEVWQQDPSLKSWLELLSGGNIDLSSKTKVETAEAHLRKMVHDWSQLERINAFFDLKALIGEDGKDIFIVHPNEDKSTYHLSMEVQGIVLWEHDLHCEFERKECVESFGKEFIELMECQQGPEYQDKWETLTDVDLPRAKVTLGGGFFRYEGPKGTLDLEEAKNQYIDHVKSSIREYLPDEALHKAVFRMLNQSCMGPGTAVINKGTTGPNGPIFGVPVGSFLINYEVVATESGATIRFSQTRDKPGYFGHARALDPSVSYASSDFTVTLNKEGKITDCSPCTVQFFYRFASASDCLDALNDAADRNKPAQQWIPV